MGLCNHCLKVEYTTVSWPRSCRPTCQHTCGHGIVWYHNSMSFHGITWPYLLVYVDVQPSLCSIYVNIYVVIHVSIYVLFYVHLNIQIRIYTYNYLCTYVLFYVHLNIHIHIWICGGNKYSLSMSCSMFT